MEISVGSVATDIAKGWIEIPRLRPYWRGKARVPLFEDVLRRRTAPCHCAT